MEGETFREVTKVSELRGGRYEALYPGPVWPGKPGTEEEFLEPRREWEWKVREVIARGSTPSVSVTDMMDRAAQRRGGAGARHPQGPASNKADACAS